MKYRYLLFAILSLFTLVGICACGNNGEGLNGSVSVTADSEGSAIIATATYAAPGKTNLLGTPIDFTIQIGNQMFTSGTVYTNNSGVVTIAFNLPAFAGTQTAIVSAGTGNLSDFETVVVTGQTLEVTAPVVAAQTTAAAQGSTFTFDIPATGVFVTFNDPNDPTPGGEVFTITRTIVSTTAGDTVTLNAPTVTTNAAGTADFPGARVTMIVPAAGGGVETMLVTWTVTNGIVTDTATTTITLTNQ